MKFPQLTAVLLLLIVGLSSCDNVRKKELFYMTKKHCFARVADDLEAADPGVYNMYCDGDKAVKISFANDSVCIGDVTPKCMSEDYFLADYGKAAKPKKVDRQRYRFSIDTLLIPQVVDTSIEGVGYNQGYKVRFAVYLDDAVLFHEEFHCSKVVAFDTNKVTLFKAPELSEYFVDGVSPVIVVEMEYYDENGNMGGWERLESGYHGMATPN
jgi:hypothetical protein